MFDDADRTVRSQTRRIPAARFGPAVAILVVLSFTLVFGHVTRAQQPPLQSQQRPSGLPPSVETQPSPSGLQIPVQPPPAPPPSILHNYQSVTDDRLLHPSDGDWLMVRRSYDGWGYSPLSEITAANVKQLQPVWMISTGMNNGHQAPPIVNNGVMFVATSYNQVIALNGKTGQELWRYRSPSPPDARVPKPVSRGVALYGDKVFFALGEAALVAIDARNGKEVWRTIVEDNKKGYYMTAAPLIANGKVVVGISGGDGPIRGFVAAYDPDTGAQVWRCYTIPAPGEPGHETWPAGGEQWETGGGATWVTGNYDPETNLLYWGVGNGNPWVASEREGDNLFTASTIAIDAATGTIKGYFQYTPNESWDFDEVSPPLLVDFARDGRTIKGLVNFTRSGYVYFLERTSGPIKFVEGKPYVHQDIFKRLDPKSGRPEVDEDHRAAIGKLASFCPSWHGGKNWEPGAYNPKTRMIYIPTQENLCAVMIARVLNTPSGGRRAGTLNQMYIAPGADHISEVQAWNVDTGKKAWSHLFKDSPNWGPILTTGGGLVFSGGTNDRLFRAFDATTGEVLWEHPTNSGVYAPASSFLVDGRQYVAVVSGWGQDARSMESRINGVSLGHYPDVPEGGVIWVFALK
jgi:alcohol dehydrogenase (cytochrome c)